LAELLVRAEKNHKELVVMATLLETVHPEFKWHTEERLQQGRGGVARHDLRPLDYYLSAMLKMLEDEKVGGYISSIVRDVADLFSNDRPAQG
jgi:hypothetical protein